MRRSFWQKVLLLSLLLIEWKAFANPWEISFGGRLTDATGAPRQGTVDIEIKFYRSANGDDLVPVTIPLFNSVSLTDGLFQIAIALSKTDFHIIFNNSNPTWIQVRDATNSVSYPRQKFSATPYALKVPVDGKFITYDIDGELTLAASGSAPGKFLKLDGNGDPVWDNIPGGGDMLSSNNLSDVADVAAARTSLGLGDASTKNVGTGAGQVAAGNHSHTMNAISDAGALATKNAIGSADITDGSVTSTDIADGTITDADINATANISHLKISGLGSAASKNVGTAAGEVAAGDHTHMMSAVTDAGALATKSSIASADITDGTITNTDINASAAIAGSKISPDFGGQTISGGEVKGSSYLQTGTVAGSPAAADCDAAAEYGRLKVDTTNNRLYVCSTSGWVLAANNSGALLSTNNLSDVGDASIARTNLGLGAMATKAAVASGDITDGTIQDGDISGSAAIAGSKVSPNFGSQDIVTAGALTISKEAKLGNSGAACSSSLQGAIRYDSASKTNLVCQDVDGKGTWGFLPLARVISSDVNLTVTAGDCASIQNALDSLEGITITPSAYVNINMPDGTYNCASTIYVKHPNGINIRLIGNEANPAAVTLNFPQKGIDVVEYGLGWIQGVKLVGSGSYAGLNYWNANGYLSYSIIIENFDVGLGIYQGYVELSNATATNYLTISNVNKGVVVNNNAGFYAPYTRVTGRGVGVVGGKGFEVWDSSTASINYSQSTGFERCLSSNGGSAIRAYSATVTGCAYGATSWGPSDIYLAAGTVSNNTLYGIVAEGGSTVNCDSCTISNNATGAYAWGRSFIQMYSSTLTGNTTDSDPTLNTNSNINSYIAR